MGSSSLISIAETSPRSNFLPSRNYREVAGGLGNSISSDTTMTNCSFTGICLNFTSIKNNTPAIAEVLWVCGLWWGV